MSDFKTLQGNAGPLDPKKRTRYADGLVLGGDELRQDQVHHLGKHRLHQRGLHGYGAVCGLDVWMRGTAEVVVEPGLAVSPRGQTISVPAAQCASLDEWLAAHHDDASSPPASPPDELELFVVLCYRECPVDPKPVPSGPCSTVDDEGVPSRIAESFALEIRTAPPEQPLEDAVRELGELLRRVEIVEGPGGIDRETFEATVRALASGSPPPASPPDPLRIHPDDVAAFLRAALRIWSREVRPVAAGDGCGLEPPAEECVLLARLLVPIAGDLTVADQVTVDEVAPPLLLSTRVLQEWLLHLGAAAARPGVHSELEGLDADDHLQYLLVDGTRALGGDWSAGDHRITDLAQAVAEGDALPHGQPAGADLSGQYPDPIVRGLQGHPVAPDLPEEHHVLRWNVEEDRWEPGLLGHAELENLGADDHPHYLLADGTRPLSGDWGAGDGSTFRIREVAPAAVAGDVLVHGQAAGGDLAGTYPDPQVAALAGTPLADDLSADDGQALVWNGSAWAPGDVSAELTGEAGRDLDGNYPDPTVVGLQTRGVSDQAPQDDEVLTWNGNVWIPRPPPVVEKDLTRIVALSWRHGQRFRPPGENVEAQIAIARAIFASVDEGNGFPDFPLHFVVGFGKEELGDGGQVTIRRGSLDACTFQVLLERVNVNQILGTRLLLDQFLPVQIVESDPDGRISRAVRVQGPQADGVAVFIPTISFEDLFRPDNKVWIVIKGDFVLDETEQRAIDAQHLRSELPSGERPRGSHFGTQGGTFESWFSFDAPFPF